MWTPQVRSHEIHNHISCVDYWSLIALLLMLKLTLSLLAWVAGSTALRYTCNPEQSDNMFRRRLLMRPTVGL